MGEFSVPTLRNDADTVEEQLTDNAYHRILPARYLNKDESGNLVEDQEDLFERVGKNIAVAEAAHHDEDVRVPVDELREEVVERNNPYFSSSDTIVLDEFTAKFASFETVCEHAKPSVEEDIRETAREFVEAMEKLQFMPNTPTLANAGDRLQMLSACFVDSPEDDIESIHDTAKEAALVFQSGGGMGYAFHHLRPYGDTVGSTGGIASGPLTFMETYDQTCETIAQGGMRRGAQMAVMRVSHPDVIQFIHSKDKDVSLAHSLRLNDPDDFTHTKFIDALDEARDLIDDGKVSEHLRNAAEGHLSNFNISVGMTSDFMEAVQSDSEFTFTNPRTDEAHIATEETKELYERFGLGEYVTVGEPLSVPANEVWERIHQGAHENGEPGVVFLDRINEEHSFDIEEYPEYRIHATNPCGEQPLMEYEACNLGHINLSTIVQEDRLLFDEWLQQADLSSQEFERKYVVQQFLEQALDIDELARRVRIGTHFLDNVVTMSDFPVDKIEESVRRNRKIGLGIMGLAQMYTQIGVEYGSDFGNRVAEFLMRYINHESKSVSHSMAETRGSFENWEDSKYAEPSEYPSWFSKMTGRDPEDFSSFGFYIRNHNTTTIAPTGTTSMVGNTTGGCEPYYSVVNFKNVSDDVQGEDMLVEFDELFLETLRVNDIDVEAVKEEAVSQMESNEFEGVESLDRVPNRVGALFVTTSELSAKEHASVQCALQNGVDSAISKTVNAPFEDTVEDTAETFNYVYENGGKGVTYYRDGTRTKQVLTTRQDNQSVDDLTEEDVLEFVEEHKSSGDFVEQLVSSADLAQWAKKQSEDSQRTEPEDRPSVLSGTTRRVKTGYGNLYVTVNEKDGRPFEVMATVGKSGATMEADTEAIARLISLSLRSGVPVSEVVDQLRGIEADRVAWDSGESVTSVADGIAFALQDVSLQDESDEYASMPSVGSTDGGVVGCPQCGGDVIVREGCEECRSCSWSKC